MMYVINIDEIMHTPVWQEQAKLHKSHEVVSSLPTTKLPGLTQ